MARTWHVTPDGTGDAPTIQAAVDSSAAGDSVEVACGIYHENDIIVGTSLTLLSESRSPECVTLDAQDFESERLLSVLPGTEFTMIGITITHGPDGGAAMSGCSATLLDCVFSHNDTVKIFAVAGAILMNESSVDVRGCRFDNNGAGWGGAVLCEDSSVEFEDCLFFGNIGRRTGAAIYAINGDVRLLRCRLQDNWGMYVGGLFARGGIVDIADSVFLDNIAFYHGGAVYSQSGAVMRITGSTLVHNTAPTGAALYCNAATIIADHCIMANGLAGAAVWCTAGGTMTLSCCNVFGNQYGDWIHCIYGQEGIDGNFSADPLFCDPEGSDYTLRSNSPCAPPGATGCGLIGALPVGCGPVSIEPLSWGKIKGAYR